MKRMLNPKLEIGDRIICYYMDGETSVSPGAEGVVTNIQKDPFEPGGDVLLISVNWDNGSKLSMISSTDAWKKVKEETIEEQTGDPQFDFFRENQEIFENFNWRLLREYLKKVQKAGPVNMIHSDLFLFSGEKWIERHYGENNEDNENFQEMLDSSEEAKNIMIQGTMRWMESKNMEIDSDNVNRVIRKLARTMVELYMKFY